MLSQRQLKVGEMVKHALVQVMLHGNFLYEYLGKEVSVTISQVKVSPDLRHATAYVLPLAEFDEETFMNALEEASPMIRKFLSREINSLKYVPRVIFRFDDSFEKANKINLAINRALNKVSAE